ncbi:heparinase II/III family protein [Desmospora activa]|uniref:Heparinase II/III-like protein n=1 Tax=Desmospora activa DSM 45169 TaxID=1121389 RepID=A0A2T4ZBZ4_9BACL|nr:heparinase II/III family protein [Desmospora activa]PTM59414.1 heparinase II/III-like protein [Desmospora activa DSM 45169]
MNRNQIRNILKSHPHTRQTLLFADKKQQELWWRNVNTSPSYQPMVDEIRREGARIQGEATPELTYSLFRLFAETGSRLEYERVYFARRNRLNTFALLSLLEPEKREYREGLSDIVWSICHEYTWCLPAHLQGCPEMRADTRYSLTAVTGESPADPVTIDLFAAETGFALSEIMRLTEPFLPQLLQNRIKEEVYRRIFWPFIRHGPFAWENATHNWSAVCAGSIGAAALHLIDDPNDLALILERVLTAIQAYLSGFGDDGACREGYGYWQYGFGFFVYFADLLKKRSAGEIDLFSSKKVHQIALFQQKCFLSRTSVVNFSDSLPQGRILLGLSHYLNSIYPDVEVPEINQRASYTNDHCSRWASAFRDLLWFHPAEKGQPWQAASFYFNHVQWLISRQVRDGRYYSFAAKGGHNGEPHNHNDVGHFILHGDGETFFADIGCGMYTAGYFGSERYSLLCNGSQGHSLPIIDGHHQSEGATCRSHLEEIVIGKDEDVFSLNIAAVYPIPTLMRLGRRFLWQKGEQPTLILEDTFVFTAKPESITERFITTFPPEAEGAGSFTLTGIAGLGTRNDPDETGRAVAGKSGPGVNTSANKPHLHIHFDPSIVEPVIQEMQYINHFGEQMQIFALDFNVREPDHRHKIRFTFQFIKHN